MAHAILSPFLTEVRGRVGPLVFRRFHGRTIVQRAPDMSRVRVSPAQAAQRERFQRATAYARAVLADPALRALHAARAQKEGRNLFALCVADYLKSTPSAASGVRLRSWRFGGDHPRTSPPSPAPRRPRRSMGRKPHGAVAALRKPILPRSMAPMKFPSLLCLWLCLGASPLPAQDTPPRLPSRTNLSQAERDLLSAQRALQDALKAKSRETKGNQVGTRLDWAEQRVRQAENRVTSEQQIYDRAMEKHGRDMDAYLKAQAKKQAPPPRR
jgi:hypothetical protein